MGTWPSDRGLSWLAVLVTDSELPSDTNHTHPEPKRLTPASSNFLRKSSIDPNADSMALADSPLGSPPPSGLIHSQNREWLRWPPPWLRTAVRLSSGIESRLA